ncbi:MAG TPA: zinc-dependent alcohol dehydrogenase [Candidatus Binatia bacterium]
MRAVCWYGTGDIRVEDVPDPEIVQPTDAIVRITSTAICGSDLHIYDGIVPTMEKGDILGHEPMGEVVEIGSAVARLKVGDRVVVPFVVSCGYCFFCQKGLYSLCDTTNAENRAAREALGQATAGLLGYSHMMGGYPGGQAEYLRVPFADVGAIRIPAGLSDDKVLFLSDIFPTGFMAAENCDIEAGDTVAVWGCGPVGQFAIQCAWMFGAERVIAIDCVQARLAMAEQHGDAETIQFLETDVYDRLMEMTDGRGPDRCIDAVGCEAHAPGTLRAIVDRAKSAVMAGDRTHVLREAIYCCRKGGTLSVPGVYVGLLDDVPFGAAMNKGITIRTGQTHVPRYSAELLRRVQNEEIDPSFVITHHMSLDQAPEAYEMFRNRDGCIKVVLRP